MGEGYHNYHHSFQRDYRNGIRWYQFDPTKWLIRSLSWIGLAKNLYRTPIEKIEISRAQMLLNTTTRRLAQLPQADVLISRLQKEYEVLMNRINEFSMARRQWLEASKTSVVESYDIEILKEKVKALKVNLLQQKKDWLLLNEKFNQSVISAFDRMTTSS